MLLSGIAADLRLPVTGGDAEITSVEYDSRKVHDGSLFCCMKGLVSDGHNFAAQAVEKGAAALLVEHLLPLDVPQIVAPDGRVAMAHAAAAFYGHPEREMIMLGVTGTNGKTSTTYMVKSIAEAAGKKVGLIGTIQNMIGDEMLETGRTTPESADLFALLRRMADEGADLVIMEVSSHALVQDRVAGIPFRVGLFTNLTQDHLDYHKTFDHYLEAKKLLFRQSDLAIINIDDAYAERMMDGLTIPIAQSIGISFADILKGLESLSGVSGRLQAVNTYGHPFAVYVDYAHTPDALENVLTSVREFAKARVVSLFGCGGDRDRTKRPLMGEIGGRHSDFVVVTSDNPRTENPEDIVRAVELGVQKSGTPYVSIVNRREAIAYALSILEPEDILVIAGKGHENYQEINGVKHHFDDREIVEELLKD